MSKQVDECYIEVNIIVEGIYENIDYIDNMLDITKHLDEVNDKLKVLDDDYEKLYEEVIHLHNEEVFNFHNDICLTK